MHHRWVLCALAFLLSITLVACITAITQQPQTKVENTTETTNINYQQLPKESAKRVVNIIWILDKIIGTAKFAY
ncbi:hypothetical protein [Nostoc sp. C117]|uniref:hypothetical protein n=1 Tax=Nostoc sp. C117 TaxID=3349875 RepID=UPI00370D00F2